ncbi:hypothetical protein GALMADRAFT_233943 [Galerina marginata CBS 339.88]|uniref:WW domain-containing protein n=1 Tax=Galerina marginata (strain CBS 339.88) TaxID=685588 RepID=A0A067TSC4_GALM3|nr:hypothetical protein GALMADRAFT_233943 [Galerina marginata CBS 339.88]
MQSMFKNPDSRPLPEGWAEHFDSQRRIWYYVDINAKPPRATFVHPCDVDGKQPASAPAKYGSIVRILQRPVGPRTNASASLNAGSRNGRRARSATVAQQLYASSLTTSASREPPLAADRSFLRQPSMSPSPTSDEVAFASSSNTPYYTSKSSNVSSTSSSSSTNLGTHYPRNLFDCTRLAPGTRRMTVNGPQPSQPSSSGSERQDGVTHVARALYHPSVNTTPSPIPLQGLLDNNLRRVTIPVQKSSGILSNAPSIAHSNGIPQSPMSPMTILSASRLNINPTSQDTKQYTAITDDNLMIMPQSMSIASSALSASPVALDVASLQDEQPVVASSSQASRHIPQTNTDTDILQPKPIRPLKGISLNLQVQVAAMSETLDKDEGVQSYSKSKRKSQLLKNFGFGKGKAKMVMDPNDGDVSSQADGHRVDESFVLVDTSM